jgi:prepilin-type N-terminal cleavage/methylation domain-containing protein
MSTDHPHRRAFTLIELMVVVAIITALIAILSPSLARARQVARIAVCASNLHQHHNGFVMALMATRFAPYPYPGNGVPGFERFWMGMLETTTSSVDAIRICPEAPVEKGSPVFGSAYRGWNGETHPPGYWMNTGADYHYGSYGINGWHYSGWTPGESFDSWLNLGGKPPSNVPVFVDSAWVDLWPRDTDVPSPNLLDPYNGGNWASGLVRSAIDRHRKAINVTTVDGAVNLTPLAKLWRLNWSKTFRPGFFEPAI